MDYGAVNERRHLNIAQNSVVLFLLFVWARAANFLLDSFLSHGIFSQDRVLWRHLRLIRVAQRSSASPQNGEVTERLKVHDWKSCVPLIRVPRVRIPPSPPDFP